MYKPPISMVQDDFIKKYVEQVDNSIFMAIERKFEADIDRDELIKALNHDRRQYEKGFADGVASVQPTWIPVTERLPKSRIEVLGALSWDTIDIVWYDKDYGVWQSEFINVYAVGEVTHWMPLPMPPKGDE